MGWDRSWVLLAHRVTHGIAYWYRHICALVNGLCDADINVIDLLSAPLLLCVMMMLPSCCSVVMMVLPSFCCVMTLIDRSPDLITP